MRAPVPEPHTVAAFELRETIDAATRRVLVGLLGAPALAALWAFSAHRGRALDSGALHPDAVWNAGREPLEVAFHVVWLGLYAMIGTRGFHVLFGALVVAALAIERSGYARHRAIAARYGVEALRDLARAEREAHAEQLAAGNAELARALASAKDRPARRAARPVATAVSVLPVASLLAPLALVALAFAW